MNLKTKSVRYENEGDLATTTTTTTTTTTNPDTSSAAETAAGGDSNEDAIAGNFQLALGGSTGNANEKAVLSIGANAMSWRKRVNWAQDENPLGLLIVHKRRDKHQTPLVIRLRHTQKQMAKKLQGRRLKDQHFLDQMFYVPIFDGELHNQSVCHHSRSQQQRRQRCRRRR